LARPWKQNQQERVMSRRAIASLICFVVFFCPANVAFAQTGAPPAPPPIVTAENEPWYLSGEPLTYEGNFYYPTGALTAFNRNEMVRSGFYRGIPLYTRTTWEPYSVVFVPLPGGFMQPYQRRRAGEIGGTIGSIGPGLPVERADTSRTLTSGLQAAGPPTSLPDTLTGRTPGVGEPGSFGTTGVVAPTVIDEMESVAPEPRGTASTGRVVVLPRPRPLITIARPSGVNGAFVEFNNARWYSSGPTVELDSGFTRIGEYSGFPVYARAGADGSMIFIPVTTDARTLLTPYTRR
jgi:hypothetical protein